VKERTVQDFVEDMVSDCRSLAEILTVALCTRWRDHKEQIKKEFDNLLERMPKGTKLPFKTQIIAEVIE